uniref:Glutamate decarboxylase-like protein 1 n=1 Tax=Magallana gigas TaxID=29159 RepID=K1P7P6_MAGGI
MLLNLHHSMVKTLIDSETKELPVCNFKQPEELLKALDLEIGKEPASNDTILDACKSVMDYSIKTGGSFANMLGMHLARVQIDPDIKSKGMGNNKKMVLFASSEAHYSIAKGASFLGFGESNVVRVETDKIGMMKPDVLDQKIQECIQQAAWGGGVILSEKYKHLMNGVHRSNSVAWNIHKMSTGLVQCSIFLTKSSGMMEECNRFNAEYLFQPDKHYDVSYDIGDKTVQCGRKVDILKLWTLWKSRGDNGMAKQTDNAFENAKYLVDQIKKREGFRLVLPECPNICFWYIPSRLRNKEENADWWKEVSKIAPQIKRKIMEDGSMMIGYNPLTTKGYVNFFRVIITNPMTTPQDMDFILDEMDRIGHAL